MDSLDGSSRESFEPISPPSNNKHTWQMEMDDHRMQDSQSFMSRLRRSLGMRLPWTSTAPHLYSAAATEEDVGLPMPGAPKRAPQRTGYARLLHLMKRLLYRLPIFVLMFFGAVHLIIVIYGHKAWFWDIVPTKANLPGWDGAKKGLADYPTDVTRDTQPIPCHSHNDYWRRVPLFDALHWGCTSVEADVWYYEGNADLLVGHSAASLTAGRTLRSLYVDPLVELLDKMNPSTPRSTPSPISPAGVFDTDPTQTLVLLIDFKTDGHTLHPHVLSALSPLRTKNYLSHWNGESFIKRPITVVGTGNAPFDLLTANQTYRDVFFDAPLDELYEPPSTLATRDQGKTGTDLTPEPFDASNSYYASVSMFATLGLPFTGDISASHLEKLRGQIQGAQKRGLKTRYWETPAWPTSLKYRVWELLVREGVDVLNVDDLEAAAKFDWTERLKHEWVDG